MKFGTLCNRIKPSKEMKAAMKVVNDSLSKYPNGLPKQLKNASNIIQQEWFKVGEHLFYLINFYIIHKF